MLVRQCRESSLKRKGRCLVMTSKAFTEEVQSMQINKMDAIKLNEWTIVEQMSTGTGTKLGYSFFD